MKYIEGADGERYAVFGDDEELIATCEGCNFMVYRDAEGVTTMRHHDDWCPVVYPDKKLCLILA